MPLRSYRLARIGFSLGIALAAWPASAKGPNVKKLGEQCQQGKPAACTELTRLARTDPSVYTREAAIAYLTDKTALAEIAKSDSWYGNREKAVKRIDDQALLAEIAKGDKEAQVRRAAVERLTVERGQDQAGLAEIATGDSDILVRLAAVAKLTDPARLIEVVKTGKPETAKAALGRVDDQAALTELVLATDTKDASLRNAALEKITDVASLVRIAESLADGYGFEYGAATVVATRIKDQPALARLAAKAPAKRMREQARAKLTDETLIAELIKTLDASDYQWSSDLKKIGDPSILADVALKARNPKLRRDALHGVRDVAVLGKAAKDADTGVKSFAAARLLGLKANASLSGTLHETSLGQPVASLKVALRDPSASLPLAVTETDAQGRFEFSGVESGDWELHADEHRIYPKSGLTVKMPATGRQSLGTLEVQIDAQVTAALASVCEGKAQSQAPAVGVLVFVRSGDAWKHDSSRLARFASAGLPWKAALCLTTSSRLVGNYVDKNGGITSSAYATDWSVVLVRIDSGQSWKRSFSADPPQQTRSYNGVSMGGSGDPTAQVLEWLKTIQ